MPADFEQTLRDLLRNLAREAIKDELTKLHAEIAELRSRIAVLETERAQAAADSVESSF